MYTLAALDPPKAIINRIKAICYNFLWGGGEQGYKYHWVVWKKCCGPIKGCLGIQSIHDIVAAFSIKLWYNLSLLIHYGLSL